MALERFSKTKRGNLVRLTILLSIPFLFLSCVPVKQEKTLVVIEEGESPQFERRNEDMFWQQLDLAEDLISMKKFLSAKRILDQSAQFANTPLKKRILTGLLSKTEVRLSNSERKVIHILNEEDRISSQHLNSPTHADMILAYNYATTHLRKYFEHAKTFHFPKTLEKREHVILHNGIYRIKSYVHVETQDQRSFFHRFSCDLRISKDRKRYQIKSFEIVQ